MQRTITDYLARFRQNRKKHRTYMAILVALSIVVAAGVTWQMQLTGISMTGDLICGQEEHTHTEACFEKTLLCAEEEIPGHFHSMDCYEPLPDPEPQLVCGQEEWEAHTHGDGCYEIQQKLSCPQAEHTHSEGCDEEVRELTCSLSEHGHGDGCYDESGQLICEAQEHAHGDDCYEVSTQRTCGVEEHTHGDGCYTDEEVLICTRPEGEGHTHTDSCWQLPEEEPSICPISEHSHGDDCYDADGHLTCTRMEHTHADSCPNVRLICAQEERAPGHVHADACWEVTRLCDFESEHTHTDECYEEVEMPTESKEDWEADLPECTGNKAEDLVSVAKSQLGYVESQENFIEDENGVIHRYTRYGHWYGDAYGDWNPMFASFCLHYAGISQEEIPYGSGVWAWTVALQEKGLYRTEGTPAVGDLVFTDEDRDGKADRVGIVSAMEETNLTAIEGDVDGVVSEREYGEILGYVTLAEPEESADSEQPNEIPMEEIVALSVPIEVVVDEGDYVCADGNEIHWKITENEDGSYTLTVSGNGRIAPVRQNKMPWYDKYSGTKGPYLKIVIEDGITTLGPGVFTHLKLKEVIFPSTLTTLERAAFNSCTVLKTFCIPSTVTSLDSQAFSLTTSLETLTVEDGHPLFTEVDGVIYNKEVTELVAIPAGRVKPLVIPNTVTKIKDSAFRNCRKLTEIILHEDVTDIGINAFGACEALPAVHLPDSLVNLGNRPFYECKILESITIPENVNRLHSTFYRCFSLKDVTLNSKNAVVTPAGADWGVFVLCPALQNITIGEKVDTLYLQFLTDVPNREKVSFRFTGPNYFTATGTEVSLAGPVITPGDYYADENGVLYRIAEGAAQLVFVSGDVSSVTVPAAIPGEDGTEIPVIAVASHAIKRADSLSELTFEAPGAITDLADFALANCPGLKRINGETTIQKAQALFPDAVKGVDILFNTGLTDEEAGDGGINMDGKQSLLVTHENASNMTVTVSAEGDEPHLEWAQKEDGTGGWVTHTRDTVTVKASISNTHASNYYYRLYLKRTNSQCQFSVEPGEIVINGRKIHCIQTSDPNVIYLEYQQTVGETADIPVTVNYPSPESGGGGLIAWGVILTEQGEEGSIVESQHGTVQTIWQTHPAEFDLDKTNTNTDNKVLVKTADGVVRPSENLTWRVELTRQDQVLDCGKDYVKFVDFEDRLTLPKGVAWDPIVQQAIEDKTVTVASNNEGMYTVRCGGETVLVLTNDNNRQARNIELTWEEGGPVLRWRVYNDTTTELNLSGMTLALYPAALRITVDGTEENFQPGGENIVTNSVSGSFTYHYSENRDVGDEATVNLTGGQGELKLTKEAVTTGQYMGEEIDYKLTLRNVGAQPYVDAEGGTFKLVDILLNQGCYIRPENMELMLQEAETAGMPLTISIDNTNLGTWEQVTGTDGETTWRHSGNSDNIGAPGWKSLTIAKDGANYIVQVKDGATYSSSTLAEALKDAGFAVRLDVKYTCRWTVHDGPNFIMEPDAIREFHIYATAKDTFQSMNADWPGHYGSEKKTIQNQAWFKKDTTDLCKAEKNVNVKREAYIDKWVYGPDGNPNPVAKHGDVLDYSLRFTHYGQGEYDNLPMVDDLYGDQYLLVPVAENSGNAQLSGLPVHTDKGVDYYVLKPGTYHGVYVGVDVTDNNRLLLADTISVTTAKDGLESILLPGQKEPTTFTGVHTEIKWYFDHLDGGNWYFDVQYKALVDVEESLTWTLGNVVWMNDRTNDRIYEFVWGGGTFLDFEKELLTAPDSDTVDEDSHSVIGEGETVTYKLTLENSSGYPFTMYNPGSETIPAFGQNLADILPATGGAFTWERGKNVKIDFVPVSGTVTWPRQTEWDLGNYRGLDGQAIVWPADETITFGPNSKICLYVTLTFPTGQEWENYTKAIGSTLVNNTLYVYHFPDTVTHELKIPGRVVLQKGVSAMYWQTSDAYMPGGLLYGNTRQYYQYRASAESVQTHGVQYYVTIYNDSPKRLYLTSLYDQLPIGFKFFSLGTAGYNSESTDRALYDKFIDTRVSWIKHGKNIPAEISGKPVTFKSARVTVGDQAENRLQFTFGKSVGDAKNSVEYDSARGLCYLNEGEAITFTYRCHIGTYDETEAFAENTIAMPYLDYQDSETSLLDHTELSISAPNEYFVDQNDGNRLLLNSEDAEGLGFTDGAYPTEEWLASQVTVKRGKIVPGISKSIKSYTSLDNTTPYTNHAPYEATLNWEVELRNTGTAAMAEYTITDTMPAPYVFEGPITLTIYDSNGQIYYDAHKPSNNPLLFTLPTNRLANEESITVSAWRDNPFDLAMDGTEVIRANTGISIRRVDGNEVISIRMIPGRYQYEIPAGGRAVLTFSSRNPDTTKWNDQVYTNQVLLTPKQSFENVSDGSMVKDENGKPVSVRASAPVTIAGGNVTSSYKQVTEVPDRPLFPGPINSAISTDPNDNVIVLKSKNSLFRYSLAVQNETSKAMEKLVLIDNLPETGDTSPFNAKVERGSEFNVSLADDPAFRVSVRLGGEETVLNPADYIIQYSTQTDFGGPNSPDWKGEKADNWSGDPTGARAIRLLINDPGHTLLPAGADIVLSFNAKVDGTPDPSAIAWNNFGYHYGIRDGGTLLELEAMPLNVGVKVPSVPKIRKELVDSAGKPTETPKDVPQTFFSFLIYEGEALAETYETVEQWEQALNDANRRHDTFSLAVTGGQSASEYKVLDDVPWAWESGKRYTIVELPCGENYQFKTFKLGETPFDGTFTYEPNQSITITASNALTLWEIELTKKETGSETLLPGAVFALYTKNGAKAMTDEAYQALAVKPERTVTDEDETIWYLYRVEQSNEDGKIFWKDLTEDSYYLTEVKAPDGYSLDFPARVVNRIGSKIEIQAENTPGFELPQTGGAGTTPYFISGLLLMTAALMIECRRRRRERGRVR